MKHIGNSLIDLINIPKTAKSIALNSASLADTIRIMPPFVPLAYISFFIFSLVLKFLMKDQPFTLILATCFGILTFLILFSFACERWCKSKGIQVSINYKEGSSPTQNPSIPSDIEDVNLNPEMQGLIEATRATAEALRARATEIDAVAQRMAESRDPAAAGQVIELIHSAVADTKIDLFLKQVIKANKIESH